MASSSGDQGGRRKWIRKTGPITFRSEIWKHYCELEGDKSIVKCDHCPKEYKYCGSTSNLTTHLRNAHHIILNKDKDSAETSQSKSFSSGTKTQASILSYGKPEKDPLCKVFDLWICFDGACIVQTPPKVIYVA